MSTCIALLCALHGALAMDAATLALLTPLAEYKEACGYDSCPRTSRELLNVHIVPSTHGEVGFQRTFQEHFTGHTRLTEKSVRNMKDIFDKVITELWAAEERTFVISDMAFFFHWWSKRDETVRRMVYTLLRQGRLMFVGGGWSMPHEPTASYHSIIDMYTYSLRKINATFLHCGRPLVTWQADSWGHSREVASLYAQMAFDGHFINPISYYDELRRMKDQRLEMIWRGSDDLGVESDIFTHKLFDGYSCPPGFCYGYFSNDLRVEAETMLLQNTSIKANEFVLAMLQRQGPHYATNHVMVVMGQRFGYFDANVWFENIEMLMDAVHHIAHQKMRLFYSSPACYLKAVNEARAKFPAEQGDFVPVYQDQTSACSGSFTSRPNVKYMAREGHVYLQMTKQLPVLANMPSHDRVYEKMNWIMGILSDHNVLSGIMSEHVMKHYAQTLHAAIDTAINCIGKAINKLRQSPYKTRLHRCQYNTSSCETTRESQYFLIIYNPLAWPVSVPVRLPVLGVETVYSIRAPNTSETQFSIMKTAAPVLAIPGRGTLDSTDHELVFIARDVPPLGFVSYFVDEEPKILERRSIYINEKYKNKKYLIRQANYIPGGIDNSEYEAKTKADNVTTTTADEEKAFTTDATLDTTTYEENITEDIDEQESLAIPATELGIETPTEGYETIPPEREKMYDLYVSSKDLFISNQYIKISLDSKKQVASVTLSNGLTINLQILMMFYYSDDPAKYGRDYKIYPDLEILGQVDRDPSANILRTINDSPFLIDDKIRAEVFKSNIVEEIHVTFSNYASYVVKLYVDQPVIEVNWLVGPIPIDKGLGREILIRYATDLKNNGVFYTDSNGRQTILRRRAPRDTDKILLLPTSYVGGNIYPVTSKIHIEDAARGIHFAVFTDRAQGGTSMEEGQVELMLHRRILTSIRPYNMVLNETEHGQGMRAIGKHHLFISKLQHKRHRVFEKKFAKELELSPTVLVTHSNPYKEHTRKIWALSRNVYSGLQSGKRLPVGVHLLTLQEWNSKTLLIRLENYLEKSDVLKSGMKRVYLDGLFKNIIITDIKETTLDGTKWLKDFTPLQWDKREEFYENYNEALRGDERRKEKETLRPLQVIDKPTMGIQLVPQQIRTFVLWYRYGTASGRNTTEKTPLDEGKFKIIQEKKVDEGRM